MRLISSLLIKFQVCFQNLSPDLVLHLGLDTGGVLQGAELTGALTDGDTVTVVIQGLTLGARTALRTSGQVLSTNRVVGYYVTSTHALVRTVLEHLSPFAGYFWKQCH